MCSIVGSFDEQFIRSACKENEYRGTHSHSLSYYDYVQRKLTIVKQGQGPLDVNNIAIPENCYCVVHQQAPTGAKSTVHPARLGGGFLWHNGIIKEHEVKRLAKTFDYPEDTWDTKLLLQQLLASGAPDNVDGCFSCVYVDPQGDFYIFRNEIAPLFANDACDISSTKFEGANAVTPNTMWLVDFATKTAKERALFKTVDSPFYFA